MPRLLPRTMPRPRLGRASLVFVTVAVALAGCGAEPAPERPADPSPAPAAAQAPEPAAPPTSAAEPPSPARGAATTLPDSCEALLPIATVRRYDERLDAGLTASAETRLAEMIGPKTMATLRGGAQQQYCDWGIPNSGALAVLGAAVIDDGAKAELIAALHGSRFGAQADVGADAEFLREATADHQYTARIILDGDVLLAVSHTIDGTFAEDAWAVIRAG